ncbi:MAG TPA: hypothetical protein VFO88_08520, partial [Gaiellaceae bacterium]|nr:hypothetical protein [Gaiellaceae bacterium]
APLHQHVDPRRVSVAHDVDHRLLDHAVERRLDRRRETLLAAAPSGNRIFATLRGSVPLTGDPHVATGSTPGVGVFRVEQGGRAGTFLAVARIANIDAAGLDRADPHALAVRGG